MVEPAQASDEEVQDQSFLEVPAILDKFKAAAQIADGKQVRLPSELPTLFTC